MLPIITYIGMEFGFLLGGVVATEAVFSFNGLGTLVLRAIRMKDEPLIAGCTLVLSAIFMLVMLLVDILYAYVDPRVKARYQRENA
jgi:peptide/nickel transport system permease protein